eukprot:2793716-Rhodomonas_salina.1
MDVISINPIDVVSDRSVGLQAKKTANNAVMRFPARDPVLKSYILNFVAKFDNCKWGFNGPNRLTDTLIKLGCMQDSKVDETEHCRGVTIYGRTKFYKYHWDSDFMTRSFTDSEWDILMTEYKNASPSTHSIHVWNKFFSKRVSKNPPADTGIAHCYVDTWHAVSGCKVEESVVGRDDTMKVEASSLQRPGHLIRIATTALSAYERDRDNLLIGYEWKLLLASTQ